MVSLVLLAAVASASIDPSVPPAWTGALQNPLLGGVIVALLTQLIKAIPQIPVSGGPKVAAVATIFSVLVGFVSAYATGSLDGFNVESAWNLIVTSVITLTSAMGAVEAHKHSSALLATREASPAPQEAPDAL